MNSYKEKENIFIKAKRIHSSDLTSEEKYDLIFSEDISQKFKLDYYDPDTSYEEDVDAFMNALDRYMMRQKKIDEVVNGYND